MSFKALCLETTDTMRKPSHQENFILHPPFAITIPNWASGVLASWSPRKNSMSRLIASKRPTMSTLSWCPMRVNTFADESLVDSVVIPRKMIMLNRTLTMRPAAVGMVIVWRVNEKPKKTKRFKCKWAKRTRRSTEWMTRFRWNANCHWPHKLRIEKQYAWNFEALARGCGYSIVYISHIPRAQHTTILCSIYLKKKISQGWMWWLLVFACV